MSEGGGETGTAGGPRFGRAKLSLLRFWGTLRWSERQRLLAITLVTGVACGFAAVGFHVGIQKLEHFLFGPAIEGFATPWIPWIVMIPALGALACGALLARFPEAAGSGIPQVKAAYATPGGRVPLRVATAKFFIGILQIGTGSSLGREGPTVQICAGLASGIGRAAGLPRKSVRRMLPVGAAAGVAAAFNAPIAAVTFAIEEIVGDLDQAVLSGVIIAAATAAAIERSVLGEEPVLHVSQAYSLEHVSSLALYAALGLFAAIVSVIFTDSLLGLRARVRAMTAFPRWARPALGGLATGILAAIALGWAGASGILGGGYLTLSSALGGGLTVKMLLVLCAFKLAATVFSYSTGGAGGIFAPALFIGGMLGGAIGHLDQALFGASGEQIGAFALVGMGAAFAGIVRAPITSVLIIFEMTDGYGLILPLMIANMTAYGLARRWRPTPIYEALLVQDGVHLPKRGAEVGRTPVAAAMKTKAVVIPAESTVDQALRIAGAYEYTTFPIVESSGRFIGFVNRIRLVAQSEAGGGARPVTELVTRADYVLPGMTLQQAAMRLDSDSVFVTAVVDGAGSRKFLGILTSSDIVRAQAAAGHDPEDATARGA